MNIIAVCGNIGSGKTTLCGLIEREFDYCGVRSTTSDELISKMFDDWNALFQSVQLDFVKSKVVQIRPLIKKNRNMVIDRSLFEDIYIFAKYMGESNHVDRDIMENYFSEVEDCVSEVPAPDISIYCYAGHEISKSRILQRPPRLFEEKYPDNHLAQLFDIYEKNIHKINTKMLLKINTEKHDFKDASTLDTVIDELKKIIVSCNKDIEDAELNVFEVLKI